MCIRDRNYIASTFTSSSISSLLLQSSSSSSTFPGHAQLKIPYRRTLNYIASSSSSSIISSSSAISSFCFSLLLLRSLAMRARSSGLMIYSAKSFIR